MESSTSSTERRRAALAICRPAPTKWSLHAVSDSFFLSSLETGDRCGALFKRSLIEVAAMRSKLLFLAAATCQRTQQRRIEQSARNISAPTLRLGGQPQRRSLRARAPSRFFFGWRRLKRGRYRRARPRIADQAATRQTPQPA